jgi:hypothetical protein
MRSMSARQMGQPLPFVLMVGAQTAQVTWCPHGSNFVATARSMHTQQSSPWSSPPSQPAAAANAAARACARACTLGLGGGCACGR